MDQEDYFRLLPKGSKLLGNGFNSTPLKQEVRVL